MRCAPRAGALRNAGAFFACTRGEIPPRSSRRGALASCVLGSSTGIVYTPPDRPAPAWPGGGLNAADGRCVPHSPRGAVGRADFVSVVNEHLENRLARHVSSTPAGLSGRSGRGSDAAPFHRPTDEPEGNGPAPITPSGRGRGGGEDGIAFRSRWDDSGDQPTLRPCGRTQTLRVLGRAGLAGLARLPGGEGASLPAVRSGGALAGGCLPAIARQPRDVPERRQAAADLFRGLGRAGARGELPA
jgi:hypothetical protein